MQTIELEFGKRIEELYREGVSIVGGNIHENMQGSGKQIPGNLVEKV
jgi:hypothetical protein